MLSCNADARHSASVSPLTMQMPDTQHQCPPVQFSDHFRRVRRHIPQEETRSLNTQRTFFPQQATAASPCLAFSLQDTISSGFLTTARFKYRFTDRISRPRCLVGSWCFIQMPRKTQIKLQQLPSTSDPIHWQITITPFDDITASLNKPVTTSMEQGTS